MTDQYRPIRELLERTRARWRLLRFFDGAARGSFVASALLAAGLVLTHWADRSPLGLVAIAAVSALFVVAALLWGVAPARHTPSDRRVARFIEERTPALDDRLVTAVDLIDVDRVPAESALALLLIADTARRVLDVDIDAVLPRSILHRAGFRAAGAASLLLIVGFLALEPARQSVDAASLLLFPERLQLNVQPGAARVAAGAPLSIDARLLGNRAPVHVRLQIEEGERSRSFDMKGDSTGHYRFALEAVRSPFTYRVTAGAVASATYAVSVVTPPRVTRIDLEYTYPASLGSKPRSEQDSGDIYGPPGTGVRVLIHADRPVSGGRIMLGSGQTRELTSDEPNMLSTRLTIAGDDSYRLTLLDRDGLSSPDDTEYFIRALDDRSPQVHITKPAGDRAVTRLEEVDVEVQADDDYGVERLELVYAVRGGPERTMALDVPRGASSVIGRQTLYLEDLDVQPGDFVSYYARARDHSAGRRTNEARSDIFFLDVRPYEQEFSLAASQSMAGSGNNGTLDELVNRQRQVVVATWKLARRAETSKGARSERDIRAVRETESNLQALVEQAASSFHESTMRDPRQRGPAGGSAQLRPEDETMAAAADAMGKAVASLEALDTNAALTPEMQALNHLLKAQAEIKRRQISANQSAAAAAGNTNRNYDISTLFDRELQRQQQTNYETTTPARGPASSDVIDRLKDLAKRQDELLRREQALSAARTSGEERRRELERLTRDQTELRERAEQLARQMAAPQSNQNEKASNTRGPTAQQGQTSRGGGDVSRESDLRDVSEAMRQAAGDLRRGAPEEAGAKSARALDLLRNLERRIQSTRPDDRNRAIGEMWLEAKELVDRQRQIAAERQKLPSGNPATDALRRLAGDQERLADRARRLQEEIDRRQADRSQPEDRSERRNNALREAAREAAGLSERMRQSADEMQSSASRARRPAAQQELTRQLERLAERLSAATGSLDEDSRKLSEQLAKAQELRDKLDEVGRALERAGRQSGRAGGNSAQKASGERGRVGEGRRGAGGVDTTELQEQSLRQLQEAQKLLEAVRRQDPSLSRNGAGFTFEGQGLVLSAPGTEGFKQDFARWELLKRQATSALEQAESALAKKLQARALKDRLAAGVEDKAPAEYQTQVDAYFKAIANRKR